MIDLDIYSSDEIIAGPNLVTFEGDARSGKGTCVTEVANALREDGRSILEIDQGQKFRVLGYLALMSDVRLDVDLDAEIEAFLESESTQSAMLGQLDRLSAMPKEDVHELLYSSPISYAAKKIATRPQSHELAVGTMFDQVAEAKDLGIDTVLIDGRAVEAYGREMHADKLALYSLAYYFQCDSSRSAQRVRKDFRTLKNMSDKEKLALLDEIVNIAERNSDDAQRNVDPMVNANLAFNLALLRGLPEDEDERKDALDQVIETGVVSVNTSHTTRIAQMTKPVVEVTRHVLADVDQRRNSHGMLHRAVLLTRESARS